MTIRRKVIPLWTVNARPLERKDFREHRAGLRAQTTANVALLASPPREKA
jgi:hypothetical protein